MKANMRYIDLHLLIIFVSGHQLASSRGVNSRVVLSKLLSYLKEAPLNFFFNLWLKLLLHVIHFKLLALEVL